MSGILKIVHVLRAPVGGLFRHVCDLTSGQAVRGAEVGVICDATVGERIFEDALQELEHICALGVHRMPMNRRVGPSDAGTALSIRELCSDLSADVVHGHGAKGGVYARVAALGKPAVSIYTPHGGSLHYDRSSPAGFLFLSIEKLLSRFTNGLIFESTYGLETYRRKVGEPACSARVIHNGLRPEEFAQARAADDAADFVFVGELRDLKGVDVLLDALGELKGEPRAAIVGSGPDAAKFKKRAMDLGLDGRVTFHAPMPAREAFSLGHTLVIPSLAESFPYIVLEALAAAKPVIATDVGGIPEMFGDRAATLVAPGNVQALAAAMANAGDYRKAARSLQKSVQSAFTVDTMVDAVLAFYGEHLATLQAQPRPASGHRTAFK